MTDESPNDNKRRIRSFVRREGRLTDGQLRALEQHWPVYGLERSNGLLNLDTCFGRSAPRTLEIGFGNGQTLFEQSAANPDIDFIGIEVYKTGCARLLRNAADAVLSNLKVYC
ncbi:MAG: tRNA (guanosine(46)-N7)-methyltransferase TrmB, partial [Nevskiales bacterium]